nr:NAD(P)H-binding protein [Bacteroidota bacterium]
MKSTLRKAVVFGATGLVGSHLVQALCEHAQYAEVLCFNRHAVVNDHPKYKEITSTLTDLKSFAKQIVGDDLFICLGTTIKRAGSKENFRRIDHTLAIDIARIASRNNMKRLLVVSSIGANESSSNFYLRTKGEMEQDMMRLKIPQKAILRPSMLLGQRKDFRIGEEAGKVLMKLSSPLMLGKLKKYKGIKASDVALAMVIIAVSEPSKRLFFESDEVREIARAGF